MCQLAKKLILNTSQKRQILYSTKMTTFSPVVVKDVIRVILTKNDVSKKCPCSKSSLGCKNSCNCYNCKNPFRINDVVAKVSQTQRRKRVKQSSQVQSSTSRKYILVFSIDQKVLLLSEESFNFALIR